MRGLFRKALMLAVSCLAVFAVPTQQRHCPDECTACNRNDREDRENRYHDDYEEREKKAKREKYEELDSDDVDDDDGGGEWLDGYTTYYTSHSGGDRGAGGTKLEPFKSIAVKYHKFRNLEGKNVQIKGYGTYRVDDGCVGKGCKDFDIYVGDDESNAHQLPDWEVGIIPIRYRWV